MTNLQVVGAGLGRTGTVSLKLALQELGVTPCHYMNEASNQDRDHHLKSILQGVENEESIKAVFEGFKATVDETGNIFYETLMKLNPNVKVILTVRDSPEVWAKSARNTIFSCHKVSNWFLWKVHRLFWGIFVPSQIQMARKIMADKRFHGVDPNNPKTDLTQMYTDWNNRVIETVPAEKLLIFNVKEGWKPLCDFLNVPVPDKPFPWVNSTNEWNEYISINIEVKICETLPKLLLLWAFIGCVYALFRMHSGS